ncbi:major facilitator superfamily domain-containing protein [Xylaria bambusicola]|uniref:major facilitator superfamily domain-containing protein n=1 Tax=Xylaria bambusicola TaxID=326684 RepID=UPI0020084A59|nr:major facilitator superfamily domain-containing protein [Xylaria bambusicola]KAI0506251.1 major facilitator superfamily domain-containing protein [Xylaria bambusicola]
MASTHSTDNTTSEKNAQIERDPDLGADTAKEVLGDTGANEPTSVDATKPAADAGPPDGGLTAWLVVLGGWCCSFSSPGWVNSVGSFQQYYEVGPLKDYSSSDISWIVALQLFFLFALGPVVGILYDNYGPRPLIIGGTLIHVVGLMLASLAKEYYQFILTQGVVSAIGVACIYSPAIACVGTWFAKKRGIAMGIMVTGSSIGGVVFPIMISRLVDSVGYPWAIRSAGFLILGLQIVPMITVKSRVKPVPKKMPMGRLAAPFTEFRFLLLLIGIFVLTYGIFIPIVYLAVQGFQEAHTSEQLSQYLVSIFNGTSLFGRLFAGFGADKVGIWNVFIIACALSGITELALWIPAKTPSIAIGFAVQFGFVSGAFIGLVGALPILVSPPAEIGYRLGVVFLAVSIPALTVAPIGGAIVGSSANPWLSVKLFAGILSIAGSAIIFGSRLLYTDKKFWKKF